MKITGRKVFNVFNIFCMLLLVLITAYPMYYVVIASFSDPIKLSSFSGIMLKPLAPFTFDAYKEVLNHPLLISGFTNTLFIVIVGTFLNIIFTSLGAYFISQRGPMFKTPIALMMLFAMYFSGGMVPHYMLIRNLGLYNTLWSLILPGLVNVMNMIILKAGFEAIPESLTESALLDGASYIKIMFKIMLPLSKATIAVLSLYYALDYWNAWFNASIYIKDKELYPVQLAVRNLLDAEVASAGDYVASRHAQLTKYALIVVVSTPIVVIYPFIQKYFTKGVMVGSVKS